MHFGLLVREVMYRFIFKNALNISGFEVYRTFLRRKDYWKYFWMRFSHLFLLHPKVKNLEELFYMKNNLLIGYGPSLRCFTLALFLGWLSPTWFCFLGTSLMLPNLRLWLSAAWAIRSCWCYASQNRQLCPGRLLHPQVSLTPFPVHPFHASFGGCCPPCPFCRSPCLIEVAVLLTQVRDWVFKSRGLREAKPTSRFFIHNIHCYFKEKNPKPSKADYIFPQR